MDQEPVKIACPLADYGRTNPDTGEWESDYFVTRPARWKLRHSVRKDEAIESANGRLGNGDGLKFAISMALMENWNLPGLTGNPEKWDFLEMDLPLIVWVNQVIFDDFQSCYRVKKN